MYMPSTSLGDDWLRLLGDMSGGDGATGAGAGGATGEAAAPAIAPDLNVLVDGRLFPAHRTVLAAAVPALRPVLGIGGGEEEEEKGASGTAASVRDAVAAAFHLRPPPASCSDGEAGGVPTLVVGDKITLVTELTPTTSTTTTTAITASAFQHVLMYAYSGDPRLPKTASPEDIAAVRDQAAGLGLAELQTWCDNSTSGDVDGFSMASLNPSIATFVSGGEAMAHY